MASENSGLLANPELLSKIDRLRENNVGQHVPLPQLVVAGDQSSGKSSLLETLTGIPFPRNLELCTRYATQITSRRDRDDKVDVAIIPGPHASDEHKKLLRKYHPQGMSPHDFRAQFPTILEEANKKMGIRTTTSDGGSVFSEDVLKIEISGPGQDYLTLIDVPGIFRTPTEGLTTKEDVALVRRMVKGYIKDSRTVILAVLPSNVDPATQEILTMAEEYDKQGERTLGVLTKPDLKRPLALGYYVARNRGSDENDAYNQASAEDMFSRDPWSRLPKDRVGIRALRTRLGQLLGQITQREFPAMRRDIRKQLENCSRDLQSLGASRQTEQEQRAFLFSLSQQYHDLVQNALDTQYHRHAAFSQLKLRLATNIAYLTDLFNIDFASNGHLYCFDEEGPALNEETCENTEDDQGSEGQAASSSKRSYHAGEYDDSTESLLLDGIISLKTPIKPPKAGIMGWIKLHHLRSRGLGLGKFDNALLSIVFREQSVKWKDITMAYLSDTIAVTHRFIYGALFELCANVKVRDNIWRSIEDEVKIRHRAAMDHALFLVSIEQSQTPYTLNHYFNENLQKSRGDRMAKLLEDKVRHESIVDKNHNVRKTTAVVTLEDIRAATSNKSNLTQSTEDVLDHLSAFYKVARKRFVDTVYQQAVQGLLLTGPKSPLFVFDQDWVLSLGSAELDMIAGESPTVKEQRTALQKKIKDLEVAIQILNK
ncbi:Interferon-induced GTP-binding protein Mx1 [Talaromyces islandicus]|uniref:Interferon-induced GTP-binding protein Mx1 n=1 Tax=Talaromyces islandicus TaxID=28573 RepID=A0A0U1LRS3_TALIS|nr:Interferon-induced GTP-binding protein Mx1 [Talaromyces islandicus]